MLEFTAPIRFVEFNQQQFSKTISKELGRILRQGARIWLRRMVIEVPVETGAAKGALKPLGTFLRVAVPIRPRRRPYFSKLERGIQSPELGASRSRFEIIDDRVTLFGGLYSFTWSTEILHYYLSIYYNGNAIPGERVIEEARADFLNFVRIELARRLPTLAPFIRLV